MPGLGITLEDQRRTGGGQSVNRLENRARPFHEYHFIDTDERRAEKLRELAGDRLDVFTYSEDCNTVLLRDVFPRAKYADYQRALCLLDPYNINLTWQVIEAAGRRGRWRFS